MSEEKYKYRKSITLTKKEGAMLESMVAMNGCGNISQFLKKILRNEPVTVPVITQSVAEEEAAQNPIITKALAKTDSKDIVEMCRKLINCQTIYIIK